MAKKTKPAPAGKLRFEGESADFGTVQKYSEIFDLFVIEGEGSVPVYIDGEMHRLPRGVPTPINIDEDKYLKRAGIAYSPAKSEK